MTKEEILSKLATHEIEVEAASKLLSELVKPQGSLYCKVSEKGAVSVYGLQRMPVTLYADQWERLIGFHSDLQAFIAENDSKLSRKHANESAHVPQNDNSCESSPVTTEHKDRAHGRSLRSSIRALAQWCKMELPNLGQRRPARITNNPLR